MSFAAVAAGSGMSTIGIMIRGDATSLTAALARGARDITAFEHTATGSAGRFANAWKLGLTSVIAVVVAIAVGLTAAGVAAAGFEQRMRNVNTLVKESDAGLASLSSSVLDLSTQLPTGANDLAEGLYQIASSGFAGAEGLQVLDAAGRAASAGLSATENAVTAISAVLNSYGLSAASASDVSDTLFQTVNLGVVEFDQLTGVIGDVVGVAAAAKVPIEDVGAAIATMTLSGVSANEAGTSLNRLLTALIQPGEALAATYERLGYESGAAALESKGLNGVMEDLRTATGGSVEAFLRLFPEVRAARGAFALAANDGQTYANVQGQIGDASERLGATQSALDEQMQGAATQWKVFTNTLNAAAIEVGTRVLPAVTDLLGIMQDLAADAVPSLNAGLAIVQPLLGSLYQVGVNLVEVLGAMFDAAEPVAKAIGGIAAGATVAGLQVLAASLEAVTGFLAEHPALVVAVAALWASRYLPSISAVAGGLTHLYKSVMYNVIWRMSEMRAATAASTLAMVNQSQFTGVYTQGLGRMTTAIRTAKVAAAGLTATFAASGIGTALLTLGVMAVAQAAQTAADDVKAAVADIVEGLSDFTGPEAEQALADLQRLKDGIAAYRQEHEGNISGEVQNPWVLWKSDAQLIAVNDQITSINEMATNTLVNLTGLKDATGLTVEELAKLQAAQGVDLTDPFGTAEATAGRDQLIAYIRDVEKQTGTSTDAITGAVGGSLEEWEAFGKAIQDATTKAQAATMSSLDVIGAWKPNIGVQEEADAIDALTDARARLAEVEAQEEASAESLTAAREGVTDAEARLVDAQATKAAGTLEAFYTQSIALGTAFSENLNTAVALGLDPAVVGRLLAEGPEQAGPILEQLVADHSGRLIEMVNASETAIAEITGQITEQARLTAMAVNSTTDAMARDLPDALAISNLAWTGATPEDIALKLGLDEEKVRGIAEAFGISIAQYMQAGFESVPNSPMTLFKDGSFSTGAGNNRGMAGGGIYPGYTPGRDIGYIGISGGEAVMRPEWTRAVGASRINQWNALARGGGVAAVQAAMGRFMGGFASGGIAGAYQSSGPGVVTVPVESTHRYYSPITVGQIVTPDVAGFHREARRRRAANNRIGG